MATLEVERVLTLAPHILGLGHRSLWTRYVSSADVLYVNFKRPSRADDSEITDEDILVRHEGSQVVGVTILHASKRSVGTFGRQAAARVKRGPRTPASIVPPVTQALPSKEGTLPRQFGRWSPEGSRNRHCAPALLGWPGNIGLGGNRA